MGSLKVYDHNKHPTSWRCICQVAFSLFLRSVVSFHFLLVMSPSLLNFLVFSDLIICEYLAV